MRLIGFRRSPGSYLFAAVIALFLFHLHAGIAAPTEGMLPLISAPRGELGGDFTGEYELREIGSDDLTLRRFLFRVEYVPFAFGAFWGEAGVAALKVKSADMTLDGDYGLALGGGLLAALPRPALGITPFALARATYFLSKAGGESETYPGVRQSRRSQFKWLEISGLAAAGGRIGPGNLYAGLGLRSLFQDEKRSTQSNNSVSSRKFSYDSGLEFGAVAAYQVPLNNRWHARAMVEIYQNGQRATLAFGQWGSPAGFFGGE